jgi:hypothetical protein
MTLPGRSWTIVVEPLEEPRREAPPEPPPDPPAREGDLPPVEEPEPARP